MKTLLNTLYVAWVIGAKDILDTLKNKSSRTNLIIMVGIVVFFYWFGTLRPFDKDVSVVVYDEGDTRLAVDSVTLADGGTYSFQAASSLADMEKKMAYRNLGLALPADLDQTLAAGGTPTLRGYIFWANRRQAAALETRYSQALTEIVGQPVRVVIGQNILIPQADASGMQAMVAYQLVLYVFWTALFLIPTLILEEKQTRTLDALQASPASPGQIVLGKALAGFFYILVIGGLAIALDGAYVVNWGMALLAFAGYALLAIGLALVMASLIPSAQQLRLWLFAVLLILVIPPLFYMEPMLKAGIRTVLTWFPTSALASLWRFSCSTGVTPAQLIPNLAVVIASIAAAFGLTVWLVKRSDR